MYIYVDLSSEVGFVLKITDQAILCLLAQLCSYYPAFCWLFLCLSSFHLGLFFASLGPKFNLFRDDCILVLNLSCHMA